MGIEESWWRYPVSIFFAARVGLLTCAWLLAALAPEIAHSVTAQLCAADCEIFTSQTAIGYWNAVSTNFFPGFFLLTRALRVILPLGIPVALIVVANAASVLSFLVLYRLFTALADAAAARIALALFAFYPFAFFQAAGYPESLAILLTATAVWLSYRNRPLGAALALAAAVLVRHVSALAGLSLFAFELSRADGNPALLLRRPRTYALLLPLLSLAGYCVFCGITYGDPISFLHARSQWGSNAWRGIDAGLFTGHSAQYVLFRSYVILSLMLAAGAIALVRHRPWREVGWYGASLMLTLWLVGIYALGRYSAACWPAFLPIGVWLSRRPTLAASLIGVCAMLQVIFFFLYSQRLVL